MRVYNGILVDGVLHVPDGDYKKTCRDCSLYEICNEYDANPCNLFEVCGVFKEVGKVDVATKEDKI